MQRTRIKICGVRDPDTALAAVEAGADAIGLVFVPNTPRCIGPEIGRAIMKALPAMVDVVGLFVDEPSTRVIETAAAVGFHTVQLHGREGPGYVEKLNGLRIVKAVAFEPHRIHQTLDLWRDHPAGLAGLLCDAPPAETAGGTGSRFDWNALARLKGDGGMRGLPPLILAGGLNPENVAEAVATIGPYGVDVSSGVESSRGVKDVQRIQAFCRAVREADAVNRTPIAL